MTLNGLRSTVGDDMITRIIQDGYGEAQEYRRTSHFWGESALGLKLTTSNDICCC
jgi:hypothetical protein